MVARMHHYSPVWWVKNLKRRKVHKEWIEAGFVEVRPGHYMRAHTLSAKQLRRLRSGGKLRRDVVWE